MQYYGKSYPRREIEARTGRITQAGGLRRFQHTEGPESGVEVIQVRTGAGLSYEVLPSRGLDICLAEFGGASLAWHAPAGVPHPAYFDPRGIEWLRTAAGGLLMTCGLTYAGAANTDEGQELGLHGWAHHLAAREVCAETTWEGDDCALRVSGVFEETSLFGHSLSLTREIKSVLGKNSIAVKDTVRNNGFQPAPHMLLYHVNFGFPLLDTDTEIRMPSRKQLPRDSAAIMEELDRWNAPDPDYAERVYYHEDLITENDWATAVIRNPSFPSVAGPVPVEARLRWKTDTLPRLVHWKMPCAGAHALGIEPANCYVNGRSVERARGTLVHLAPGEELLYELELEVSCET